MDFNGRVALVTGAARRLGRAFALAMADAGADVVVHHRRSSADGVVEEIRKRGRRAAAVQADLLDPDRAAALVPLAAGELGPIDILINSASVYERAALRDTDLENWETHLGVNLRAPYLLIRAFAEALGERPGKIVNVADWRAVSPGTGCLAYTVSKAGLLTLTQSVARELAPRVQVNALALGAVLPPPGGSLDRAVKAIPAGRTATVEETCEALLFLLGNDYVTGETLFLDGGARLR